MTIKSNSNKSKNLLNVWVILYCLFGIQALFSFDLKLKIIFNLLIIAVFLMLRSQNPIPYKKVFIVLGFLIFYFLINEFVYKNLMRLLNNVFFVEAILLFYIKDDSPIENFLKSLKISFFFILPFYLFNYSNIVKSNYSFFYGILNRNAVGQIISGYALAVLSLDGESWRSLKFAATAILGYMTKSRGSIYSILVFGIIAYCIRKKIINFRYLALIIISGYCGVLYYTYSNYILHVNNIIDKEWIYSKLIVWDPLYMDFLNSRFTQLLFGIDYCKLNEAGSDFEYTLLIVEILYKFGIMGALIFFVYLYRKLREISLCKKYKEMCITVWTTVMFIFGAGLFSPSPYMFGFWLLLFSSDNKQLQFSKNEYSIHYSRLSYIR